MTVTVRITILGFSNLDQKLAVFQMKEKKNKEIDSISGPIFFNDMPKFVNRVN